jgi:repressor LexA
MLTERQRGVLEFIQSEQREKGITPSTREIQHHFGFASQTSVMQYIDVLERKGFLDRHARKARALITPVQKVRITDVPIYGQIPAGMASLTEQTVEGHVSLDSRSVNASKNGRTFALRVRGDSMIGAHIVDGDVVILEARKDVQNGDIVAALIDGETTLKRYVTEHGRPYLKAENPSYPNLIPAREAPDSRSDGFPGAKNDAGASKTVISSIEHNSHLCHSEEWQRAQTLYLVPVPRSFLICVNCSLLVFLNLLLPPLLD